jgi:SPP1 family predicted phage head-tail adaptor
MPAITAGRLRHRIEIQAPVIEQDEVTGEMQTTWASVAFTWAEIVPSSGHEFMAAGAEQSEVRGRITIRYRDGMSADMRILHRGNYYNILAILPDAESGREHLSLMVGEGIRFYEEADPDTEREGLELEVGGLLALE